MHYAEVFPLAEHFAPVLMFKFTVCCGNMFLCCDKGSKDQMMQLKMIMIIVFYWWQSS